MKHLTFGMIKPDAVADGDIGPIIGDVEGYMLRVVDLKMRTLTRTEAEQLYIEHAEKAFYKDLIDFTVSGPVVLMLIEDRDKDDSVYYAFRQHVEGVLRMRYGTDVRRNAIHASDSREAAAREVALFFPEVL